MDDQNMTDSQSEIEKTKETLTKMKELLQKKEGMLVERRAEHEAKKGTPDYNEDEMEQKIKTFADGIETDKVVIASFEEKLKNLEAGQ